MRYPKLLLLFLMIDTASASVVTFATTSHGVNEWSGTGTTSSYSYASSTGSTVTPTFKGGSFPSPPSCNFPCFSAGPWELGEAYFDATTGKGKSYAHTDVSLASYTGGLQNGFSEAGFNATDVLNIDVGVPFFITLDLTFAKLNVFTAATTENDFATLSAIYKVVLSELDDPLSGYEVTIHLDKAVVAGQVDTSYTISVHSLGAPVDFVSSGESIPDLLHVKTIMQVDPATPGTIMPYAVDLSMYTHATCQTDGPPNCVAVVSSPGSSYIAFNGVYTSQNGYGYLGLAADPASSVPEPTTWLLAALVVTGVIWRHRLNL